MLDEQNTTSVYPQENLSIVAVTWNLFASLPPINSLVQLSRSPSFLPPPDLIFIGTQQCQRSLFLSFCCEAKRQWESMLLEVFGEYSLAGTEVMRGLHSAVLVRNKLRNYYTVNRRQKLRAGTCGIMGNKGAISIEISVFGQVFQMINCHLAPHQTASDIRNNTIGRIYNELLKKDANCQIIFLGDFNYRIEMTKDAYQQLIATKSKNTDEELNYYALLERDQMINQQALKRNFLKYFQEGKIGFPPTYKMQIGRNQYNRSRIPGWTDRIFTRKSVPGQSMMQMDSYVCGYNILGCDHRPVIARYSKPLPTATSSFSNNYGKKRRDDQSNCQLI